MAPGQNDTGRSTFKVNVNQFLSFPDYYKIHPDSSGCRVAPVHSV
jgi:hypothetical protein